MLVENKDTSSKDPTSEPEIEVNSHYGEGECEESQKEIERFESLKKSKNTFIETLEITPKKKKKEKENIELRMKDLIKRAEQLASFLLTRHKLQRDK